MSNNTNRRNRIYTNPETDPQHLTVCETKIFSKIVDSWKLLILVPKNSILNVSRESVPNI